MYSTAGTKRCVLNVFGQVLSEGSLIASVRVRSSNAAAASVARMKLSICVSRLGGSSIASSLAPALR